MPRCEAVVQIIDDELRNFNPLIVGWHEKAAEGDCFSRFVFEYLSFIAHVKNNLFYKANNDRAAIQELKRDRRIGQKYLEGILADSDVRGAWNEIIEELENRPLHNTSLDFDNPEIDRGGGILWKTRQTGKTSGLKGEFYR